MPHTFELATAARIVFGAGKRKEAPAALKALGAKRVLLVAGRTMSRAEPVAETLAAAGLTVERFSVEGEPTVEMARDGARRLAEAGCDAVVAVGGGSVIDAGKAFAALVTNGGDPLDYLEVVGRGQPLTRPSLPFVALPTTAGTGSEVTRNAVLGVREGGVKASLRSPGMLPRLAIVDPELLAGAPPAVIAASGLDALSQLIEPFLSARANPFTDALAREGIQRSARSLRRAHERGLDAATADDLALASLFGGLCLANAGLGAVHGYAAPIGGMFPAPHGAVCAALLPAVLEVNQRALATRAPADAATARFGELAALLTGDPAATTAQGIAWVRALCAALEIPRLSAYGVTARDVPALVMKGKAASSMKGNPIALTDQELMQILLQSI